jgi:hypothetical protein
MQTVPGTLGGDAHDSAEGQKSYWDGFHRDVTLNREPIRKLAKSGAWGRALHSTISGSDQKCPQWLQQKSEPEV